MAATPQPFLCSVAGRARVASPSQYKTPDLRGRDAGLTRGVDWPALSGNFTRTSLLF